jgi:hypothetical protein
LGLGNLGIGFGSGPAQQNVKTNRIISAKMAVAQLGEPLEIDQTNPALPKWPSVGPMDPLKMIERTVMPLWGTHAP